MSCLRYLSWFSPLKCNFSDIVDDNQNEPYNEIDSGEPEVVPDLYRYEEEEETLLSDKAAPKR